ncbi:MAG: hypothetical protein ACM3PE_12115 [Deltaproteobacteria bacterium]
MTENIRTIKAKDVKGAAIQDNMEFEQFIRNKSRKNKADTEIINSSPNVGTTGKTEGQNLDMDIKKKIDLALKRIWTEEIPSDYNRHYLLEEDSLKCALYYHLRFELGEGWLNRYRIRIYPELHLEGKRRADLAIVRVSPKNEREGAFLGKCIEDYLVIIELKYKAANAQDDVFYSDVTKLKEYAKIYPKAQLYTGFIKESGNNNGSWFDGRQTSKWAKGRVTELLGYREENTGNLKVEINKY